MENSNGLIMGGKRRGLEQQYNTISINLYKLVELSSLEYEDFGVFEDLYQHRWIKINMHGGFERQMDNIYNFKNCN